MQETKEMQVQALGGEDPLEEDMATHSSILAWRIPWTEEPGGLQSMDSPRVGHDWSDLARMVPYDLVITTWLWPLYQEKHKKAKWLSEEALQIAEKRREAKGKIEKERYTHLNAEFQRTARRDKKAFLSDHGKEIEENNRLGNSRDLFKKIRDTKIAGRISITSDTQMTPLLWQKAKKS